MGTDLSSLLDEGIPKEELCRGTSVVNVLAGCGKHLGRGALAGHLFTEEEATALRKLSRPVDFTHDFISHSWQDGRIPKAITLYMHYNGWPAIVVSSLIAVFLLLLRIFDVLPTVQTERVGPDGEVFADFKYFPYTLVLATFVEILVLLTWHRLPEKFGGKSKRTLFFDKLCVHQHNKALKAAGCRSFSAFVALSHTLVVLWSPVYLERLWCSLELASLAHLVYTGKHISVQQKESKEPGWRRGRSPKLPLKLLPLTRSLMPASVFAAMTFVLLGMRVSDLLHFPATYALFTATFLKLLILPMGVHSMRRYMRDRRALSEQLERYDVRSTRYSNEGDKAMVLDSIVAWFGTLDDFNSNVRTAVRSDVLASVGLPAHLPARHILLGVLPLWFDMLDTYPSYLTTEAEVSVKIGDMIGIAMLNTWVTLYFLLIFRYCYGTRSWGGPSPFRLKATSALLAACSTLGWLGVNQLILMLWELYLWQLSLAVTLVLAVCTVALHRSTLGYEGDRLESPPSC